jgi:membrane protein DedA with SNARE-associated domain
MIELVDPFFPAIIAVGCFTLVAGACGFWLGSSYGRNKADKAAHESFDMERTMLREAEEKLVRDAFAEGRKLGIQEATPKHDKKTGRFTS